MTITEPDAQAVARATAGDLAALDALLSAIQPGVFNLALRMLGNRDDAADAAQEILLKVTTHLSSFRAEAAFSTWVYSIARRHLLDAATKSAEAPVLSLEAIAEKLGAGLDIHAAQLRAQGERALTPEDKLQARQTALSCTQGMLMTLPRSERLAWILDVSFNLPGEQAAAVLEIEPAAYRQRLGRAREKLDAFVQGTCGLANPQAACRCEKQAPAIELQRSRATAGAPLPPKLVAVHRQEMQQAAAQFDALVRLSDAAALLRAHPEYRAPDSMRGAIRAVLRAEGWLAPGAPS
jgi:RNA polymerase sigma factor (sigma-70 family)